MAKQILRCCSRTNVMIYLKFKWRNVSEYIVPLSQSSFMAHLIMYKFRKYKTTQKLLRNYLISYIHWLKQCNYLSSVIILSRVNIIVSPSSFPERKKICTSTCTMQLTRTFASYAWRSRCHLGSICAGLSAVLESKMERAWWATPGRTELEQHGGMHNSQMLRNGNWNYCFMYIYFCHLLPVNKHGNYQNQILPLSNIIVFNLLTLHLLCPLQVGHFWYAQWWKEPT